MPWARRRAFICAAEVPDASAVVEWQLDGRTVADGRVATILLPAGQKTAHQVQVFVRLHQEVYDGGSQVIY
jgi:hypothetical protein